MKIAIFIADEGYGHAMRQKNIIHELLDYLPFLQITVYGKDKLDILKDEFEDRISYVDIFNLLLTAKDELGNLDLDNTKDLFKEWNKNRSEWIEKITKFIDPATDLIISDSVPQISEVAKKFKIRQLNVQHFTWDWLYQSLYGIDEIFNQLNQDYLQWGEFVFPPLTPVQNLKMFDAHLKIGLIVNRRLVRFTNKNKKINTTEEKSVLLMNNGTQSLSTVITRILFEMPYQKGWKFLLRSEYLSEKDKRQALQRNDFNIITGLNNTHMAIANSDIVIARGGYNIICELLALNKPSVIIDEKHNPEIQSNLILAKNYKNIEISLKKDAINRLHSLMQSYPNQELFKGPHLSCIGASQVLLKIASDFNLY